MKVTLAKLSVCPCGFPLLNPSIKLGAEYEIEPDIRIVATLICGGCGKRHHVPTIYVYQRGQSAAGYLPEQVFSHKHVEEVKLLPPNGRDFEPGEKAI